MYFVGNSRIKLCVETSTMIMMISNKSLKDHIFFYVRVYVATYAYPLSLHLKNIYLGKF